MTIFFFAAVCAEVTSFIVKIKAIAISRRSTFVRVATVNFILQFWPSLIVHPSTSRDACPAKEVQLPFACSAGQFKFPLEGINSLCFDSTGTHSFSL